MVFWHDLAGFRGDDFKASLPHECVVYVIELRAFAECERLVELDDYAGTVLEPSDFADGSDVVSAYDDRVFGL